MVIVIIMGAGIGRGIVNSNGYESTSSSRSQSLELRIA